MNNDIFSQLEEFNKAEVKNFYPYADYIERLKSKVKNGAKEIMQDIKLPDYEQGEFIIIKEPLEFLHLFREFADDQTKCREFFEDALKERDPRVVDQVVTIDKKSSLKGYWFNTTKEGINLRLGLEDDDKNKLFCIKLRDEMVHGMITGRTGAGKSVLINQIILTLLAEYAPWELSLYLADFKRVELSRYLTRHETPHVRAVAATGEIRYVLSLLEYLMNCMVARQTFLSRVGETKLEDLRDNFNIVLPRTLILIDEFQQMFNEKATARQQSEISNIILQITKLGRATGFHLLFASQEMSGTGVSSNVFSNFKVRIALPSDKGVSRDTIGNPEAADLEIGWVISNTHDGDSEGRYNRKFRVPFVQNREAFYAQLETICNLVNDNQYSSPHKFYQEDAVPDVARLNELLEESQENKTNIIRNNDNLLDIFILGESVVYNRKKYDYETFFIESGLRKNIAILTPAYNELSYVCWLLAQNFKASNQSYRHIALIKNETMLKQYDITADLGINPNDFSWSTDIIDDVLVEYERRKVLMENIGFINRSDFDEFTDYIAGELIDENIEIFEHFDMEHNKARSLIKETKIAQIEDLKVLRDRLENECGWKDAPLDIIDVYIDKKRGKSNRDCFEPLVFWIIGADMVDDYPSEFNAMIENCLLYNVLVIFTMSDKYDAGLFHKNTWEYRFTGDVSEQQHFFMGMDHTNKTDINSAIDFKIQSANIERAFKKFNKKFSEIKAPELDFDEILKK